MVKMKYEIYLPSKDEPESVISWGKSPELVNEDLAKMLARIGGDRSVNYGQSYLLAAHTLLQSAIEKKTLDHHGLPIFYLQRHAAELIIKEPLNLALSIVEYSAMYAYPADEKQRKRASSCHCLNTLLSDLDEMSTAFRIGNVPSSLKRAVDLIISIEEDPTWSRYSFRLDKKLQPPKVKRHLGAEVVLPLGEIQNLLQSASDDIGPIWPPDGWMGKLGEIWENFAREAGDIY